MNSSGGRSESPRLRLHFPGVFRDSRAFWIIKEASAVGSSDVVLAAPPAAEVEAAELRPRIVACPGKRVAELLVLLGPGLACSREIVQEAMLRDGP